MTYTPRSSRARYTGILVARAIVTGDVQLARELARTCRSFRVCEARAIAGACDYAAAHYGVILHMRDFMGGV